MMMSGVRASAYIQSISLKSWIACSSFRCVPFVLAGSSPRQFDLPCDHAEVCEQILEPNDASISASEARRVVLRRRGCVPPRARHERAPDERGPPG